MPVIEVRGLTKRFGQVLAVDRLSFEVEPGTWSASSARTGPGRRPRCGCCSAWYGRTRARPPSTASPTADLAEPLHQVGAVLEASSFHPGRTARNHLRIQALAGQADPSRIDDVLELIGLGEAADRRVGGFSLGMRQRLGLATALLTDPELLILDEPANGLDPEGVRWLRDLLRGLAAEGSHGPGVQPHPGRGRPDGGLGGDPRPRAPRHPVVAGRADRGRAATLRTRSSSSHPARPGTARQTTQEVSR